MVSWKALVVVGITSALIAFVLIPPTPLPDRLAVIPESAVAIDNQFYDLPEWVSTWRETQNSSLHGLGLLNLLNPARVPYFERNLLRGLSVPLSHSHKFLDVGCGAGIATEALARRGYRMVGIDMSANSLAAARQHAERGGIINVDYIQGSAYDLPFANNSFDGVVCSDVMEHLLDLRQMVKEVRRVLKPGGVFVLDTINRSYPSWIVSIVGAQWITGAVPPNTHDWRLFITPLEMKSLLTDAGFEFSDASLIGFRPSIHPTRIFQGIIPGLLGDFVETSDLSNNYLAYATKPLSK